MLLDGPTRLALLPVEVAEHQTKLRDPSVRRRGSSGRE
jgi:hypothetical protein